MKHSLVFFLCVLTWNAVAVVPAAAYVRESVNDKPGVYLYWSNRVVGYAVYDHAPTDLSLEEVVAAIKQSANSWMAPPCTDITLQYEGLTSSGETNLTRDEQSDPDSVNVIRWRNESWPPDGAAAGEVDASMLAVTLLIYNARTGQIVDADIDLNGVDYNWTTAESSDDDYADVQNVVTHEMGHLLGLDHSEQIESTMYWSQGPGEVSKRYLHDDDITGLCEIYPAGQPTVLGPDQSFPPIAMTGGCVIGQDNATGDTSSHRILHTSLWILGLLGIAWLIRARCFR